MIPSGVDVYIASKPVDFRKGPVSLMAIIRDAGTNDPLDGSLYVFRSKRADRIKVVWFDGGICLFSKTIETKFCWPPITDETVQLSYAQLLTLLEGMDWRLIRRPEIQRPQYIS